MRVLVAYASRHGSTMGIAQRIAAELERQEIPVAFKRVDEPIRVESYQACIIGSSVYLGRWEPQAAEFVRTNAESLSRRPVWLFCSGPVGTDHVDKQGRDALEAAQPKEFAEFADLIHPKAEQVFYGVYDPARKDATLAERLIMKVPAIRNELPAGDFRDWDAIESWAEGIVRALRPTEVGAAAEA
ncbi:MAG: flavodoxin domain-containing protein [Chloroflexi bacterium]|nr:flavodoxin domain-containing protein [Chloroflexota bacterium]